jgi:hypothetical protein
MDNTGLVEWWLVKRTWRTFFATTLKDNLAFMWKHWWKPRKPQFNKSAGGPRLETGTCRIRRMLTTRPRRSEAIFPKKCIINLQNHYVNQYLLIYWSIWKRVGVIQFFPELLVHYVISSRRMFICVRFFTFVSFVVSTLLSPIAIAINHSE